MPTRERSWLGVFRGDGRWLVGVALCLYFGWVFVGSDRVRYAEAWQELGVEPMVKDGRPVPFADTVFLLAAAECYRDGVDVFERNPCDPWGRRMNYPRVWLALGRLGVDPDRAPAIGVALATLFFVSALWFAGPVPSTAGAVWAAALLSPSLMLGVERGNADLALFVLVAAAVGLLERGRRVRVAYSLIGLAALLKIFPIAAMASALRERRRSAMQLLVGAVAGLLVYLVAAGDTGLHAGITHFRHRSFGGPVLWDLARDAAERGGLAAGSWPAWTYLAFLGATVGIALLLGLRARGGPADRSRLDGLRAGTAIYALVYVPLTNFDYKQVFLLLALPQVLVWSSGAGRTSTGSRLALAAWIATLWMSSWDHVFVAGEILSFLLFAASVFVLAWTLPEWARPGRRLGRGRIAARIAGAEERLERKGSAGVAVGGEPTELSWTG